MSQPLRKPSYVFTPVSHHQQDSFTGDAPRHVRQKFQRRRVRPLKIIHEEDQPFGITRLLDQLQGESLVGTVPGDLVFRQWTESICHWLQRRTQLSLVT